MTLISSGLFSPAVSLAVCSMWISQMFKSSCIQGHQKQLFLTSSDCDFFEKSWSFSVLDSTPKNSWFFEVTWGWNWKPWKVWFSKRGLKQKWDVYAKQHRSAEVRHFSAPGVTTQQQAIRIDILVWTQGYLMSEFTLFGWCGKMVSELVCALQQNIHSYHNSLMAYILQWELLFFKINSITIKNFLGIKIYLSFCSDL